MAGECYCGGRHPDWDYHTPTGCAMTIQGLKSAQERHERIHATE